MVAPTIQGGHSAFSGTGSSSGAASDWPSAETMAADPEGAPGGSSGAAATEGVPRVILESAAGHQVILTYHDLALLALLVGVALSAAGWFD